MSRPIWKKKKKKRFREVTASRKWWRDLEFKTGMQKNRWWWTLPTSVEVSVVEIFSYKIEETAGSQDWRLQFRLKKCNQTVEDGDVSLTMVVWKMKKTRSEKQGVDALKVWALCAFREGMKNTGGSSKQLQPLRSIAALLPVHCGSQVKAKLNLFQIFFWQSNVLYLYLRFTFDWSPAFFLIFLCYLIFCL